MNKWGIPDWLEREVKDRDKTCVYCGIKMIDQMPPRGPRKAVATWEHIINNARIVTRENIALCCASCNSSKGTKILSDWIQSNYCKKRGINKDTVGDVVKAALKCTPNTHYDAMNCVVSWINGKILYRLDFQPTTSGTTHVTLHRDHYRFFIKLLSWADSSIPYFSYMTPLFRKIEFQKLRELSNGESVDYYTNAVREYIDHSA
jgi:hypothetical protein